MAKPSTHRAFLAWALLLLAQGTVFAADWPQWRGPSRDNVWTESGIVSTFPAEGLTPRWKVPVGYGLSSPVIAGGMRYLSDLVVEKPVVHERVHCFNAATGKKVWTSEHDATPPDWFYAPDQTRGPGSTPVVHEGRVYAIGMFYQLTCLDARTGAVIWKRDLRTEYQLPSSSLDASPLVDGNLLIAAIGGKPAAGVVAFDLLTGNEVWRALAEEATWSSPVIVSAGGARQLIVWMRKSITSLNPANGELYWREPTVSGGSAGFSAVSTPVLQDDRLLVSGLMFQLDRARPTAKVLWPDTPSGTRRILSDTSTPLMKDGFVYGPRSGGAFVFLEAGTGREVWHTNTVTELRQGACVHLISNGSSELLFTDQGDLVLTKPSPAGYRELARTHVINPTAFLFNKQFA